VLSNPRAVVCSVDVQFAFKHAVAVEVNTAELQMHARSAYEEHPAAAAPWDEQELMQVVIAPDSAEVTPDTVVEDDWAMAKAGMRRAVKMATRMIAGCLS